MDWVAGKAYIVYIKPSPWHFQLFSMVEETVACLADLGPLKFGLGPTNQIIRPGSKLNRQRKSKNTEKTTVHSQLITLPT